MNFQRACKFNVISRVRLLNSVITITFYTAPAEGVQRMEDAADVSHHEELQYYSLSEKASNATPSCIRPNAHCFDFTVFVSMFYF